jgi:hypothetical protein
MAGAGRKVFTAGDVLTASQVQDYLQDQAVMVFASDAARTSGIASPSEGMLALSTDTDLVNYYNGTAWVSALPIGAWTAYTPTISGITFGTGSTTTFSFCQIGKTVHVRGLLSLGTGGTVTGTNFFSMPVTASSFYSSTFIPIGVVAFTNLSSYFPGTCYTASNTSVTAFAHNAAGTITVNSTPTSISPFTWAVNHKFILSFTYEAA